MPIQTFGSPTPHCSFCSRVRLKRDGSRAETGFRLSSKRTSPFKSARASFQWTAGSRGVRIRGSNAGYTAFRGSVRVLPTPFAIFTVCHQVSNALYFITGRVQSLRPTVSLLLIQAKISFFEINVFVLVKLGTNIRTLHVISCLF